MEEAVESRRIRHRRELHGSIVDEALHQLREGGVSAISLRGIGRSLGMSAPAIYTYFPSLTDLITELIVRCTLSLADALRHALPDSPDSSVERQLRDAPQAYRQWALAHRREFNLIFFDQIIGYSAPESGETVSAQSEMLHVLARPFAELHGYEPADLLSRDDVLDEFLGWWGSFHGLIALEVNHHLDWRNSERIFHRQIEAINGALRGVSGD
ncbi:TetR/AcrR family transcriptional regulator [Mycetocola tolaasinivorans]|uniref:TetR/AcrR family transcriptional regulator n=1 Tax=Mycetocola tolaasinivorans TaxID=76635 RepID=A0A3L7A9C8_9MICO|nr:WHG domain-containing protein [Mycetocola tolaasinivorans]RLP76458.1 TetR/AcrR family transcriptional regulator [Mycetocola tolaasinivorans]